jgi:hypothetical protein
MKKLAIMAALVVTSIAASATDYSLFAKDDYDRISGHPISVNRAVVGAKADFKQFGALDLGFADGRASYTSAHSSSGTGYDVGYSNGVSFGRLGFSGRVGASKFGEVRLRSLALEASYPFSQRVTGFVGAEHLRGTVDHVRGHENAMRYTIGTNLGLTPNTTLRVGYARTEVNHSNASANGFTTALVYKF